MGLLSTLGSVFSAVNPYAGLIGIGADFLSNKSAQKDASKQFQATTLTARVNEAKRLGLSPLAVLGSPTASPTVMAGQSQYGSQLKDAINAIAQAEKAKQVKPKDASYLDTRAKLAEVRRMEAEADLAEKAVHDSTLSRAGQSGQPRPPPQAQAKPVVPLHRTVTMPDGSKRKIVDVEVAETEVPGTVQALMDEYDRMRAWKIDKARKARSKIRRSWKRWDNPFSGPKKPLKKKMKISR